MNPEFGRNVMRRYLEGITEALPPPTPRAPVPVMPPAARPSVPVVPAVPAARRYQPKSRRGGRGGGRGGRQPAKKAAGRNQKASAASKANKSSMGAALIHGEEATAVAAEFEEEESGAADTFEEYWPQKLKIGIAHPDAVVETSSLASVEPNDISYTLSIEARIIDSGALSALQLESISYACQAHTLLLSGGKRAGFLIGDGAGVGKGRTIAGVILENYLKGRRKSIWFSVSADLKYDAERDLSDIHAGHIEVKALKEIAYGKIGDFFTEGVLFSTYTSLIGKTKTVKGKVKTRLDQILEWCGPDFDGCIVFDESHKAKNLCMEGSKEPTKTGKAVEELQTRLPKARIVYASATGASETRNMAYMVRLGLWGPGTPFHDFRAFCGSVEKRGIGIMEIVAMDMKRRGIYIARQLSFRGVTFETIETQITPQLLEVYNDSVALWTDAWEKMKKAADMVKLGGRKKMMVFGQFWGAHQRFFRYLCMAAKVDKAVEMAKAAVAAKQCVVIGLQSTGEARTLHQLEAEEGELSEFVSGAKGVFEAVIDKHFPLLEGTERCSLRAGTKRKATARLPLRKAKKKPRRHLILSDSESDWEPTDSSSSDSESEDEVRPAVVDNRRTVNNATRGMFGSHETYRDRNPNEMTPAEIMEATTTMRLQLLEKIEQLGPRLPRNMLDDLVHKLGGPDKVAEMTGRKGRVVKDAKGVVEYELRAEVDVPLEKINLMEKDRFMQGDKQIAIISEAASSGISLQSDRRVRNQRQRIHITLELPWSADRAIQQFGRTHRSNQVNAPKYIFLISDLGGERRFAATVARRLESLGALTHGDRRATETQDLSAFNMDNKFGRAALSRVMKSIWRVDDGCVPVPADYPGDFIADAAAALTRVGLEKWCTATDGKEKRTNNNISKFLNRLLGLPVKIQNYLFQYFTDTLSATISEAKRLGTFDYGIQDFGKNGEEVVLDQVDKYNLQHSTGVAPVELYKLRISRGVTWEAAVQRLADAGEPSGFYVNYTSSSIVLLVHLADDRYQQVRPHLGATGKFVDDIVAFKRYNYKVPLAQAEMHWTRHYDFSADKCSHQFFAGRCALVIAGYSCYYGLRNQAHVVLTGSVLAVWTTVEGVFERNQDLGKKAMRVYRVKISDDLKIIGLGIPERCVDDMEDRLQDVQIGVAKLEMAAGHSDESGDNESGAEYDDDYY